MEREHDQQAVMAFIVSAKPTESGWTDSEGYVMFTTPLLDFEIRGNGRLIGDFLNLASDLPTVQSYPSFMTWEGSVRYTEDDYYTSGKWRASTEAEVLACRQGCSPFGRENKPRLTQREAG